MRRRNVIHKLMNPRTLAPNYYICKACSLPINFEPAIKVAWWCELSVDVEMETYGDQVAAGLRKSQAGNPASNTVIQPKVKEKLLGF